MSTKTKPALVPKLRFPEFRGAREWTKSLLIGLGNEPLSNGVFNDPKRVGAGYKLINVSDMYIDTTIDEGRLSLLELRTSDFEANKVIDGDIFFTRSSLVPSGIAASNIYLGKSCDVTFDGHLIRFRPNKSKVAPLFAHYLFKTAPIRSQLIARGKSATMTTIGQADVASVTLSYPEKNEQQAIADCLKSVDELMAAQARKVDALKTHKKGLMQQLFPSEGETQPRLRFPELRNAGQWVSQSFRALYEFKPTNTYSRDQLNYESGAARNIHYGDIHSRFATSFHMNAEVVPFVNSSESLPNAHSDAYCQEGDMVFADASEDLTDVGKSIELTNLNGEKVLSGSHTILARRKGNEFMVGFAGYLFKGRGVRAQIEKEAQGTKVLQISPRRLAGIKVTFPTNTAEQQRIASCLSSLDALITAETQKLKTLKTHKRGLMQQLFPSPKEEAA